MNRQAFLQRLPVHVFRINSYVCVLALIILLLVGGLLVGPSTRKAKASTLAGSVWAPLGFGLNDFVTAIAVSGNDVYVGGAFTAVCGNAACNNGNVPINHIARWDGTQWTSLGFGLNAQPYSIVINGSKVYVAGPTMICGDAACSTGTTVQGLSVWDGGSWSAPFPPLVSNTGCCYTLAFLGNNLYAGGLGKIAYPPENEDSTRPIQTAHHLLTAQY